MKTVKNEIKKILEKLENNNYEAYIVGGYVRDLLLSNNSLDVDIATSAKPQDIKDLFKSPTDNYGSISIKVNKYNIDITSFRKELKYDKRKPISLEFIDSVETDSKRRDFTINALYMDKDGNILDFYNGLDDLNNKVIRMIGNVKEKLEEDPLRILRAIRFATILDFSIDSLLNKGIQKNYKLVNNLSDYRIKEELSKIINSNNYIKGLHLLDKYKILKLDKVKNVYSKL